VNLESLCVVDQIKQDNNISIHGPDHKPKELTNTFLLFYLTPKSHYKICDLTKNLNTST